VYRRRGNTSQRGCRAADMGSGGMTGFAMPTANHGHPANHRRLAMGTTRRSGGGTLSLMGFALALLISALAALRGSFSTVLNGLFWGVLKPKTPEPTGNAEPPESNDSETWRHVLSQNPTSPPTPVQTRCGAALQWPWQPGGHWAYLNSGVLLETRGLSHAAPVLPVRSAAPPARWAVWPA